VPTKPACFLYSMYCLRLIFLCNRRWSLQLYVSFRLLTRGRQDAPFAGHFQRLPKSLGARSLSYGLLRRIRRGFRLVLRMGFLIWTFGKLLRACRCGESTTRSLVFQYFSHRTFWFVKIGPGFSDGVTLSRAGEFGWQSARRGSCLRRRFCPSTPSCLCLFFTRR
jgi:hypothetical protein